MLCGTASRGSSGKCSASGRWRCFLLRLCRLLAAFRRLGPELLREPLDATFGIEQLLPSSEERVTIRADFEVQLGLGRLGLPGRPARAARLDVMVLGVDVFLHGDSLPASGKLRLYTGLPLDARLEGRGAPACAAPARADSNGPGT